MVRLKAFGKCDKARCTQPRQDMPFFVLVVQRSGDVEIAQYIGRGTSRLRVDAVLLDMGLKSLQQLQRALNPLVAGRKHLERGVETHGWTGMQDRTHGDIVALPFSDATMAP